VSEENIRRVKEQFRKALGRDLTLEEQKYLALSAAAVPSETPDLKVKPKLLKKA